MATPTPTQLTFYGVFSESNKIINGHFSRHLFALSFLFLLPIFFSLFAFRTLQFTITKSDLFETLLRYTPDQQNHNIGLEILCQFLLYTFTVPFLSLCATGTITYSVYHEFFGRPVKFISAIKTLSKSLIRLFATVLSAQMIIFSITFFVGLLLFVIIRGIELLGFQISYSPPYREVAILIGLLVLVLGLLYQQVNWSLAYVIVTVESSWGFDPLKRSTYLIKGMRGVSASLMLYFGAIFTFILFQISYLGLGSGVLNGVLFVIGTIGAAAWLMVLLLHSVAANTVLYIYCKAFHGELAGEFARDYVSLPFDEEKVPHVVSAIQP